MLARALKVRDYLPNGGNRHGIDTAALDQPGDEASAYGRAGQKWQPLNRRVPSCDEAIARASSPSPEVEANGHFSPTDGLFGLLPLSRDVLGARGAPHRNRRTRPR